MGTEVAIEAVVEAGEEEIMELEIPAGISKAVMINFKAKTEVEIMKNQRWSAFDVTNLAIMQPNVTVSFLLTNKSKKVQILLRRMKKQKTLLMTTTQVDDEPEMGTWYVDTGCSNHMSGNKLAFLILSLIHI